MPGLAGFVSSKNDLSSQNIEFMLDALRYGRAKTMECFNDNNVGIGCVQLGTGGQRALFESDQAVVVFFGYLTNPPIPPGADKSIPNAAARLIHDLYLVKGEEMMHQIAGSFAIAVWNKRTQTLLLANDHLGFRPIYFAEHNGLFRFASEVKGILADPNFPHRMNMEAMADFFYYSYLLEDKTFFQDIQVLPPASLLKYYNGHWVVSSYWDVVCPNEYPQHPNRWYDDLIYNAIQSSVNKMIRPELRYGLALSGGLDSRWIAAFLGKNKPGSLAFTLGTPGSDDTPIAQKVASSTGLVHNYVEISPSFIAELGERYAYLVDGMDSLGSMDEFSLTVRIGDHVDVAVGGMLGGPIFGYEINPLSAVLRKRDVLPYYHSRFKGDRLPQPAMAQSFGERLERELNSMANNSLQRCIAAAPCERGFQVMQYINLRNHQPRCINAAQLAKLSYVDVYHPLTDEDVLQASLQLPPGQLMMEEAYRRAMVTHIPELSSIPWTFTLTPLSISAPTAVLKKIAQHTLGHWLYGTRLGNHPLIRARRYYTNYYAWSRGPLRSFIEKTLLSPELEAIGLFNQDGLRTVICNHMEGKLDATSFLGQALSIAFWTHLFFTPSVPIRPDSLL